MTQFQKVLEQIKKGEIRPPSVMHGESKIPYMAFQLINHKFALSILAKGLKMRTLKYTELKAYYGLKARKASDGLNEFMAIFNDYKNNKENGWN